MSIAEKLVTIAENEPKVFHAGQIKTLADAESLNGKLQGATVKANDVANTEHSVPCRLESKNLFDASQLLLATDWTVTDGVYSGYPQHLYNIYNSNNGQSLFNNFTPNTQYTFSFKGYSDDESPKGAKLLEFVFVYDDGTQQSVWTKNNVDTEYTMTSEVGKTVVGLHTSYGKNPYTHIRDIQLEVGTQATPYTPYITDFSQVEVSRYGKNLFEFKQGVVANGSIVEGLDNGAICQGELSSDTQHNSWVNGWYTFANKATVTLKVGDTVTISCDYTVLELAEGRSMDDFNRYNNKKVNIHLYHSSDGTNNLFGTAQNQPTILGEPTRLYITYTVKADGDYYPIFTLNSNKVRIENIQIEYGSTPTTYEPFKEPTTYTANADGIVNGITSIAPNMTLLTNAEGVIINANYYKDPDIVVTNLLQSIALSGGDE